MKLKCLLRKLKLTIVEMTAFAIVCGCFSKRPPRLTETLRPVPIHILPRKDTLRQFKKVAISTYGNLFAFHFEEIERASLFYQ